MDFNELFARMCGVKLETIKLWNKKNKIPEYAVFIKKTLWEGKIYYKHWSDYYFSGHYLYNKKTGQFIDKDEIEKLWVIKQQLNDQYKLLFNTEKLHFNLDLNLFHSIKNTTNKKESINN